MKLIDTSAAHSGFRVLAKTMRSEAAIMELQAEGSTGGADNKHVGEDQWLYVVSGTGKAIVAGKEQTLGPGSLLLIEAGETHEIMNTGANVLRTLNFYAPPAY
jgi:mannose-6-phosphate isomerase-like protein (cupin superfamily)